MKISLFIGAVLLLSNFYVWVNARSLKKDHVQDKDVDNEDKDSVSKAKFVSQISFIEEFLAFSNPNEDGEQKEKVMKKVIKKEEKFEEKVNERHDKIFWSDDELYQLQLGDNYSSKESHSNQYPYQYDNSIASKNHAGDKDPWGREAKTGGARQGVPLTPASDRQLVVAEFSPDWVEERYSQLLQGLPAKIEEAEEVIRQTIATQRMLGYTFVVSFVMAAVLDSLALLLIAPKSLTEAITLVLTDKASHGFLHWVWWYAFGFSGMASHLIFLPFTSIMIFFLSILQFC